MAQWQGCSHPGFKGLSLILGIHIVEENQFLQIVF